MCTVVIIFMCSKLAMIENQETHKCFEQVLVYKERVGCAGLVIII